MKNNKLKFIAKKYKWGYTVWIKKGFSKVQIANKLETKTAVREFVKDCLLEWR